MNSSIHVYIGVYLQFLSRSMRSSMVQKMWELTVFVKSMFQMSPESENVRYLPNNTMSKI